MGNGEIYCRVLHTTFFPHMKITPDTRGPLENMHKSSVSCVYEGSGNTHVCYCAKCGHSS